MKNVEERAVRCVMVADGVYKYVYVDTGEDVNNEDAIEEIEIREKGE